MSKRKTGLSSANPCYVEQEELYQTQGGAAAQAAHSAATAFDKAYAKRDFEEMEHTLRMMGRAVGRLEMLSGLVNPRRNSDTEASKFVRAWRDALKHRQNMFEKMFTWG